MAELLWQAEVLCHPLVVGELACGHLRNRAEVLALLSALPQASRADNEEVRALIDHHGLAGRGLGLTDVHLLASCALGGGVPLCPRDRRLAAAAEGAGIGT